MKKLKKIASLGLCMALVLTQSIGVFAQSENIVTKDENVFITLNPDGSVDKQIISDWLHSDAGFENYNDKSCLTDIINLKSETLPTIDGENLIWDTEDYDIYYQGNADITPPIEVEFTYTLDGNEITAEDLVGKSGHLDITLKLTNNQKKTATINGESKTIYTPFAVAVVCDLPVNQFKNVKCEDGLIQSEGTNQILGFVSFPGLKENFDGVFDTQLAEVKASLKNEYVISSDVTDFNMPSFIIAATTSLGELKEIQTNPEFDSLLGGLEKLKSATEQLATGTQQLSDATKDFDGKMSEFQTSYQEFDAGIANALDGATKINAGTTKLKEAANTLKNQINTQLVPGLQQTAPLQQQLNEKMAVLDTQLENLSIPDMTAIQTQLATAIGDVCDQSSEISIKIATGSDSSALSSAQQAQLTEAKNQIKQEASEQITAMMSSINMDSLSNLKTTLEEIDELSTQLLGGMNTLTSALYDPNDDINNPKTVANAIIALSVGADDLNNGAVSLKSGLNELNAGSDSIYDVINQFKDGTTQLSSKTDELNAGMQQYYNEGLGMLEGSDISDDMNTAIAILNEMQESADNYNTYTGSNADNSKVKFIMKTNKIKTQTENTTDTSNETTKKKSFWQRIIDLFKDLFD